MFRQGIGPVDDTVPGAAGEQSEPGPRALTLLWSAEQAHGGAVNCLASHDDLLATASRWVTVDNYTDYRIIIIKVTCMNTFLVVIYP